MIMQTTKLATTRCCERVSYPIYGDTLPQSANASLRVKKSDKVTMEDQLSALEHDRPRAIDKAMLYRTKDII